MVFLFMIDKESTSLEKLISITINISLGTTSSNNSITIILVHLLEQNGTKGKNVCNNNTLQK